MMDNSSSPERMYILLISNQLQNIVYKLEGVLGE